MVQRKSLLLAAVSSLAFVGVADAGPDYQALKKCLRDCINTTPPGTWARAICGLDCLADYADSKLSLANPAKIRVATVSTNYNPISDDPRYGYLNLIGVPSATVSIDIITGATPVSVNYLLFDDNFNAGDPDGAHLLGSSSDAGSGFALNFAPAGEGYILAEAHYTSSPSEDIDEGWAVYYSTQSIPEPGALALVGGAALASVLPARHRRR